MGETTSIANWLKSEIERAVVMIDKRDRIREEIFRLSREVIRCSGRAVTYLNAMDLSKAVAEINNCTPHIENLVKVSKDEEDLIRYGLPLQAFIEYCEAIYLLAVIGGKVDDSLARYCMEEAPPEARLLAIGDLTGEIKRHAVNLIAEWRVEDAEAFVKIMKDIYSWVKYLDYPDSLVPGFRHKVDVMRRSIEDLEVLLAETITKRELINRLEDLKKRIPE
ncbi:haloacid dehalogenase [Desulfurococcaceae archaeon AG1]|jgi:translin|nr:MAG: hypothetical protein DJ555_00020 [Desulfurococcaceae archaeon]GAY25478.1 haloacid dehalogenase [Desulfurococcaceae archaeon AG1]